MVLYTAPRKLVATSQIRDRFQTPNYAIDMLVPFIPSNVSTIWEPAAGGNKIVNRLRSLGYKVIASDILYDPSIHDYNLNFVIDSLNENYDCIITNPPFSIKDLFIERAFSLGKPFAFLISANYYAKFIEWIKAGCQRIVPSRRINYISPDIIRRVNNGEGTDYKTIEEIPPILIHRYSAAQFHSIWLTYNFDIGSSEVFVDISLEEMKSNI